MKKLLFFIGLLITTIFGYSQGKDISFVHTSTAASVSGAATIIDHPALNNNPTAELYITHTLGSYNNKSSGVFYAPNPVDKWAIYNEDTSTMIAGKSFFVYVPGTWADTVTAVSTGGFYYFVIDDPALNNKPGLHPVITHNYGGYLNDNFGVYYTATDKWGIYNTDPSVLIPAGEPFFILAEHSDIGYNTDMTHVHTATVANQASTNGTFVDHPLLNNNPDAMFILTPRYVAANIDDHVYGTWYDPGNSQWHIFTEDLTPLNSGEMFHLVISLPAPPNDLCVNAIPLTVGINFGDNDVAGTLLGSDGANFGCVWFKVTVPVTGKVTIETDQASGSPMHDTFLNAFSGSCGSPVYIISDDNSGNGNFSKISLTGLTPGDTLFIQIEEDLDSPDPTSEFLISAYDPTLGIADAIIEGFSMYPNPVENVLNLSAVNAIDALCVYNMLGQEVLQSAPSTNQVELDTSSLPSGAYIIKVQAGEQIGSYNLIKE